MTWALVLACALATVPAGLRWLRVAQREHYLAPSVSRFALRWWRTGWFNFAFVIIAIVGLVGSVIDPVWGFAVVVSQIGPIGLSIRGRTSALAWTARLKRVAALAGGVVVLLYLVAGLVDTAVVAVAGLFALPAIIDVSLLALAPLEKRMGDRWVEKAATRLRQSGARVVAITGSYGKTTTKQYLAHLLGSKVLTVASPASFNNRMGLAKAINENLVPGTEVFIAEMGTYGPGEIADLCEWIKPDVGAIVSIGPVHLERFKTESNIVRAKAEILAGAATGVVSIDHPLLADLAGSGSIPDRLLTVSGEGKTADVVFDPSSRTLSSAGRVIGTVPPEIFGTNLGMAVAIARALDVEIDAALFEDLPRAEHRQTIQISQSGFTIIDDTFNSNPAGARLALDRLAEASPDGRKVVVTPGMVELGTRQREENSMFGAEAAAVADDVVVVGQTNRLALLEGSAKGRASVTVVANREEAVEWVTSNLTKGDAVLYENDLPDHYP